VLGSIESFPSSLHELLIQGSAVALAVMILENPWERDRLYALYGAELGCHMNDALHAFEEAQLQAEATPQRWYGALFQRLDALRSRGRADWRPHRAELASAQDPHGPEIIGPRCFDRARPVRCTTTQRMVGGAMGLLQLCLHCVDRR
jgi:hypothetical protein